MARKKSPIPKGFRTITPHLTVNDASAAIEFYKQAFDAVEKTRSYAENGVTIVHSELKIGNSLILLSDEFPEIGILAPSSVGGSSTTLHLYVPDVDKVWDQAVTAGAVAVLPLQDTYWGDRFGKLVDPFGHYWSLASRVEMLSRKEIARRKRKSWRDHVESAVDPDESNPA